MVKISTRKKESTLDCGPEWDDLQGTETGIVRKSEEWPGSIQASGPQCLLNKTIGSFYLFSAEQQPSERDHAGGCNHDNSDDG